MLCLMKSSVNCRYLRKRPRAERWDGQSATRAGTKASDNLEMCALY